MSVLRTSGNSVITGQAYSVGGGQTTTRWSPQGAATDLCKHGWCRLRSGRLHGDTLLAKLTRYRSSKTRTACGSLMTLQLAQMNMGDRRRHTASHLGRRSGGCHFAGSSGLSRCCYGLPSALTPPSRGSVAGKTSSWRDRPAKSKHLVATDSWR